MEKYRKPVEEQMVVLESLQTHKLEFFPEQRFRAFEEEKPEAVTWGQVEDGEEQHLDGQHITNFFFYLAKEPYLLLNIQKCKVGADVPGRWDSGSATLPTTCPSLLFVWVLLLGPEGENLQQRARKETSVFSALSFTWLLMFLLTKISSWMPSHTVTDTGSFSH